VVWYPYPTTTTSRTHAATISFCFISPQCCLG